MFEGTLLENITLFTAVCSEDDKAQMTALCALVNLKYPLSHRIARNGENLSGGEIAKTCLIRELYREKSVLFINEPLNDVDDSSEKDILNFLIGLDKTVVMVSACPPPFSSGLTKHCGCGTVPVKFSSVSKARDFAARRSGRNPAFVAAGRGASADFDGGRRAATRRP